LAVRTGSVFLGNRDGVCGEETIKITGPVERKLPIRMSLEPRVRAK